VTPKLKIVALNTIFWYIKNKAVPECSVKTPGHDQFVWLQKELMSSRMNNEKVYLTGHVPPSIEMYKLKCYEIYVNITAEFSDVILGHLYGHTHDDNFVLIPVPNGMARHFTLPATGVANIVPSVMPSYNPSFRIWRYDAETGRILDYDQYMADLDESNAKRSLVYVKEYSFLQAYKSILNDFSVESFIKLQHAIETNSTVRDLFNKYRYLGSKASVFEYRGAERLHNHMHS